MKNSGFKMKGYTYPGASPMKGKAQMKRDAARTKADEAQEQMNEAFDNQFKPTTKSLSPMVKKSPARQAELLSVAPEIAKQSLTEVAKESFIQSMAKEAGKAAITTGISAVGGALTKDRKKERRATNTATMNQNFGSTKIT